MSPQLFGPSTSKERRQKRQTSQIWTWFAYSHRPTLPHPILIAFPPANVTASRLLWPQVDLF
jgi:hypothetical protein